MYILDTVFGLVRIFSLLPNTANIKIVFSYIIKFALFSSCLQMLNIQIDTDCRVASPFSMLHRNNNNRTDRDKRLHQYLHVNRKMLPIKLNWNFQEDTFRRTFLTGIGFFLRSTPTEMQPKPLLLFICKTHNRLPLNTNPFDCTCASAAVAKSTNQTARAKSSVSCSVCLQFRKTFTLYDIEIFVFRKMQITLVSHYYSNDIHVRIRMTCRCSSSTNITTDSTYCDISLAKPWNVHKANYYYYYYY